MDKERTHKQVVMKLVRRVRLIDCRRNGNQHVTDDDAIRRQMNTTIFFRLTFYNHPQPTTKQNKKCQKMSLFTCFRSSFDLYSSCL